MSIRIGIDLGTTNSAAAMVYNDGPHLIPRHGTESVFLPSTVFFRWKTGLDDYIVGEDAEHESGRVVRSVKRLMGRTYEQALKENADGYFGSPLALEREMSNDLRLAIPDDDGQRHHYWPQEISALILREIRKRSETLLKQSADGAVITVPAYFEAPHRTATLDAARIAGIPVLEPLIDEPTAAALAFARTVPVEQGEPLLVVDWGGGTLDVVVMVAGESPTAWQQHGITGDLNLGGDHLDDAVAEYVVKRRGLASELLKSHTNRLRLREAVREAKHTLSVAETASVLCNLQGLKGGRGIPLAEPLSREVFESQISGMVNRLVTVVGQCLDNPNVPRSDIRRAILVGGSTLIPLVKRRLQESFHGIRFHHDVDPMNAVALGAAIYAEMQRDDVFRICPYGYMAKGPDEPVIVIDSDQDIPTPSELPYILKPSPRTTYDGQTVVRLRLQPFIKKNGIPWPESSEVRVFARALPPQKAGAEVECRFWLDENKTVKAAVTLQTSEQKHDLQQIQMGEVGPEAVFSALTDASLEAEALLEGNRDNRSPLLSDLRACWNEATAALDHRDPVRCAGARGRLEELLSQIRHRGSYERDTERAAEGERERVLNWLSLYERHLLPAYWPLLTEDERTTAIESIRRIRIMNETGAPPDDMGVELWRLNRTMEGFKAGAVLTGAREAMVVGVPQRIKVALNAMCGAAADLFAADDQDGYEAMKASIYEKLKEGESEWRKWHETSGVKRRSPDLTVQNQHA